MVESSHKHAWPLIYRAALSVVWLMLAFHQRTSEGESMVSEGVHGQANPTTEVYAAKFMDPDRVWGAERHCVTVDGVTGEPLCNCAQYWAAIIGEGVDAEQLLAPRFMPFRDCEAVRELQKASPNRALAEPEATLAELSARFVLGTCPSSLRPAFGELTTPADLVSLHSDTVSMSVSGESLRLLRDGASFEVQPLFRGDVDSGPRDVLVVQVTDVIYGGSYFSSKIEVLSRDARGFWVCSDA